MNTRSSILNLIDYLYYLNIFKRHNGNLEHVHAMPIF